MRIGSFAIFLFGLCGFSAAQNTANDFYKFSDCYASSTYSTGNGVSEYDAHRALQPGTGYWSSAGHHSNDEEVTWVGTLSSAAHLKAVRIGWAYSPEEVQISVSSDGSDFHVAVPWKRTPSSEVSFDEDINFEHPETAKAIKISMRKAIHDYFGINEVSITGSGEPLLMLISGITSISEACLQVEEGKFNTEGAEVVLDSCAVALAASDGRELWRQNNNQQLEIALSNPPLCMTLQGKDTAEGGKIILYNCLKAIEEGDGRSNWSFEGNSQLRLKIPGSFCLSQKNSNGDTAGVGDMIATLGGNAKSTSTADSSHGAQKAIDNSLESYWASGGFESSGEHIVYFDVDLGKKIKLVRIRIDWEYPAFNYKISSSNDGQSFVDQSHNMANPSNSTLNTLNGMEAQHVRITMIEPHPRYGKTGDKFVYGIRQINIFANKLQSIVEDCRNAGNSDDARDKYFVEYTSEFDSVLAEKLANMNEDVISRTKQINEESKKLEALIPQMESCLKEKKEFDIRMVKLTENSNSITFHLNQITNDDHSNTGVQPGDSPKLPAEDCFLIKARDEGATSGFYWIEPKCAPEPLRMYCDMETGTAFYVWNGSIPRKPGVIISSEISSVEDVSLHCAEIGLEPIILRSASQLKSLEVALQQMGYHLEGKGAIPLGYDYGCKEGHCSGKYHDLYDGVTDLSSLLLSKSIPELSKDSSNTIGLGLSGMATNTFDISTTDIMAIVCSTNTMEGKSEMSHLDVECDTTLQNNDGLKGIINTNIVVECPTGCEETQFDVFGTNGVYSDTSSICRAAIHAGLIQKGGMINVSLESESISLDGSIQNGIESKSLPEGSKKTIRIGTVAKDCPIDMFENQPSSFIEASSFLEQSIKTVSNQNDEPKLDPAVVSVIEDILATIDQIHGIDPQIVVSSQENAAEVIAKSRKQLKPAEKLQKKQGNQAILLYDTTEILANNLYEKSGNYFSTLEHLNEQLEQLEADRSLGLGFLSYKLNSLLPFADTFEVFDSLQSKHGPSKWEFSEVTNDKKNVIEQLSSIVGLKPGAGTFAKLKNHKFYDSILSLNFMARGDGSIGIAFRMKGFDNYFMLELDHANGVTRLIKSVNGNIETIATENSGGFINDKWFTAKIETTQGLIQVFIGESGQNGFEIFNVIDEEFLSGSIGLFTSGIKNGAYFSDIEVEAKTCKKITRNESPIPLRCSHFKETYFGSINSMYEQVEKDGKFRGIWQYKNNIGGRKNVITQLATMNESTKAGTSVILKGNRTCNNGFISFDYFNECPDGIIGAIYNYENKENYNVVEVTPKEIRIREIHDNSSKIISTVPISIGIAQWHKLNLNFEGKSILATLISQDGRQTLISGEHVKNHKSNGRVGLSSTNCAGAAFDNFELSPFKIESETKLDYITPHEKKSWHKCNETVHLLQKRDLCFNMLSHEPQYRQVSCAQNFCSECCRYHTSLLNSKEEESCMNHCQKNEKLSQKIEDNFLSMLSSCIDGNGSAFNHCKEYDATCKLEACHLCCLSSENVKDIEGIAENLIAGASEREVSECKYQCSTNFA